MLDRPRTPQVPNTLVMSDRGRTYSIEEIRALLASAGLRDVEWHGLGLPRGTSVVTARKA